MNEFEVIDTKDPVAVCNQAQIIYRSMFEDDGRDFVSEAFDWFVECFAGNFRDFQGVDMAYHDREHTLQGTLCYVRILHGRHLAKEKPVMPRKMFELGLLAILLHDSGYLKRTDDVAGTGAKYTLIHVDRSCQFARELMADKGFVQEDVAKVQHMILCTLPYSNLDSIPFQAPLEKITGVTVATADLLGQMSAADYVERLSDLFDEFDESWKHSGRLVGATHFESLDELLENTPVFWEGYVKPKLKVDCLGMFRFLNRPCPDGPNEYLKRVEANIARIEKMNTRLSNRS